MKVKVFLVLAVVAVALFSCKQTLEPTLIVTVQDTLGNNLDNAYVFTDPCMDPGSPEVAPVE